MTPYSSSGGSALRINTHLLLSFLMGVIAWAIWPHSPEWWGLGLISIILSVGAFAEAVAALRAIVRTYRKEKAFHAFLAKGGNPKSSHIASNNDLRRAGMFDE